MSEENKKDKYKRLRRMLNEGKGRKATAELEGSRDPIGFAKRNIEPSLKGKKGIAV